MDGWAFGQLLTAIVAGSIGQLLLKRGVSEAGWFRISEPLTILKNLSLMAGFTCYGGSTLLYLKSLATIDLSVAYPSVSLSYVLVVLGSRVFFREPISRARWIAVGIICVGVMIVGRSSIG